MKTRILPAAMAVLILLSAVPLRADGWDIGGPEEAWIVQDGIRYDYILNDAGGVTILGMNEAGLSHRNEVRIPEILDGYPVTAIGDGACMHFYDPGSGSRSPERVFIPPTVTRIGANPFLYWFDLKEIAVDPGQDRFEAVDGALYDTAEQRLIACPMALEGTFTVRGGTKVIGRSAFGGLDYWGDASCAYTGIVLPDGVEEIGERAFEGAAFTYIELPASLRTIGNGAFLAGSLERIAVNDGLERIGRYAFRYTPLREVGLPDSLVSVSPDAFANCEELRDIRAPQRVLDMLTVRPEDCWAWTVDGDGGAVITDVLMIPDRYAVAVPDTLDGHPVTGIADRAFRNARQSGRYDQVNWYDTLERAVIPASVTYIGVNPFAGVSAIISEIAVDPANERYESVDGALYDKQAKILVSWPEAADWYRKHAAVKEGTLEIGEEAFLRRSSAGIDITLPEGLAAIGRSAFEGCCIRSINIPSTVEAIGERVFFDAAIKAMAVADGLAAPVRDVLARALIEEGRVWAGDIPFLDEYLLDP